eukprot:94725_1
MVVTTKARTSAHMISFIINLIVIGGLCVYITYKRKQHLKSKWIKWRPVILCWISFPFIMADPMRHILQNYNIWESCSRSCYEQWPERCNWSSSQYQCIYTCGQLFDPPYNTIQCKTDSNNNYPIVNCSCIPKESVMYLSFIGVLITICCTYIGFGMFLIANLWHLNIMEKCNGNIIRKYTPKTS